MLDLSVGRNRNFRAILHVLYSKSGGADMKKILCFLCAVTFNCFKLIYKLFGDIPSRIVSGIAAELMMILGYFVFEGFMYGFTPSVVNIPANGVQGIAGLIYWYCAYRDVY